MISRVVTLITFCLVIVGFGFAKEFKGGEVQSKESFHYGKFETRFYASNVSGVLSTMFLFENDGWKQSDIWQEIDVEVFGKSPTNQWQSNLIWETNPAGPTKMAEQKHVMQGERVNDWHVYTVEWTPDYVSWSVDEVEIRRDTTKATLAVIGAKPMLLMFNIWSHTSIDWVGRFSEMSLPTYQFVDYVRAYKWVAGEKFESDPVFEDEFEDDLDNWNISTHSFDENRVTFSTSNVFTQDGYLVLGLCSNAEVQTMRDNCEVPVDPEELMKLGIELYPKAVTKVLDLHAEVGSFQVVTEQIGSWVIYDENRNVAMKGQGSPISTSELARGVYQIEFGKRKIRFNKPW